LPNTLTLELPATDQPVYVRLAEAVIEAIRTGRLQPGRALPGTRTIAAQLHIHRNTVLAAWSDLRSQGWITATPGGATRVAPLPPSPAPGPASALAPPFDVAPPLVPQLGPRWPRGTLALAGGKPDLRLVPVAELARAWRAALRHTRGSLLAYGDPRGHERLRTALADVLSAERGLVRGADDVLITRGSQMALYLAAAALVRPGDRVAIEELGYPPAWTAFELAGAELVPIRVDGDGLDIDHLEAEAKRGLRAVYTTPHHQFPTMVTLPADRRLALLDLATRHGFAIIEDDYDNEFHFAGRPVLPLAAHDRAGVTVYVGTLSKTLAPGLRLGYAVAAPPILAAMTARRLAIDRQGDLASEYAIATLIEDGTLSRHHRRMRRIYAARQQDFATALHERLGDALTFDVPGGGLALWVHAPGVDVDAWAQRALARGVGFEGSRRFDRHQRGLSALRAGFASLDPHEVERAVDVLATTHPSTPS
jgi:GntR family transcriptional regulator/MocR family aminotransferase